MNTKWQVHLHSQVVKYLVGLGESGQAIRSVIARLPAEGLPPEAKPAKIEGHWIWVDARHWITCALTEEEHAIYVTNVESVEDSVARS